MYLTSPCTVTYISHCTVHLRVVNVTLDPKPVGLIASERLPIASTSITTPCWTMFSTLEPTPVRIYVLDVYAHVAVTTVHTTMLQLLHYYNTGIYMF